MRTIAFWLFFAACFALPASGQEQFERDVIKTSGGDLEITFIGHGSLLMKYQGKVIYVDPFSKLTDFTKLPKADLVLITHEHQDHLDQAALFAVKTAATVVVLTDKAAEKTTFGTVMRNGETRTVQGVGIEAVPAYNLVQKRENGQPYHPKGAGNGYVLTFGATRVYIAGDTENTPEMKALRNIDIAFLPMNLPYTMTPEMTADGARGFKPKVLYPYHYGDTDPQRIVELLKTSPEIEVRIRRMR
jgi:L-ascorbate metabolism protein UlaG (beta-lactamase superfamily)